MTVDEIRSLVQAGFRDGFLVRFEGTVLSTANGFNHSAIAVLGALLENLGRPGFLTYCRNQRSVTKWFGPQDPISKSARHLLKAARRGDPTKRALLAEAKATFILPLVHAHQANRGRRPDDKDMAATVAMFTAKILWDMELGNAELSEELPMLASRPKARRIQGLVDEVAAERFELPKDELLPFLAHSVLDKPITDKILKELSSPDGMQALDYDAAANLDPIEAALLDLWVVIHPGWKVLPQLLGAPETAALLDSMRLSVFDSLNVRRVMTAAQLDVLQDREQARYDEWTALLDESANSLRLGRIFWERLFPRTPLPGVPALIGVADCVSSQIIALGTVLKALTLRSDPTQ